MSGPAPLFPEACTRKLLPFLLRLLPDLESAAQACTPLACIRTTEALHRGVGQPAKHTALLQLFAEAFGTTFF